MTTMYILVKNNVITHTYSINVRDKAILVGWKYVASISGYNVSISYEK